MPEPPSSGSLWTESNLGSPICHQPDPLSSGYRDVYVGSSTYNPALATSVLPLISCAVPYPVARTKPTEKFQFNVLRSSQRRTKRRRQPDPRLPRAGSFATLCSDPAHTSTVVWLDEPGCVDFRKTVARAGASKASGDGDPTFAWKHRDHLGRFSAVECRRSAPASSES